MMSCCFYFDLHCGVRSPRVSKGQIGNQALPHGRASDTMTVGGEINDRLKMTQRQKRPRQKWTMAMALLGFALATPTPCLAEKLKPEEIVARHLESIGPAKARTSPRIMAGTAQVIFRSPPPGQAIGKAVLASDGLKY